MWGLVLGEGGIEVVGASACCDQVGAGRSFRGLRHVLSHPTIYTCTHNTGRVSLDTSLHLSTRTHIQHVNSRPLHISIIYHKARRWRRRTPPA